MNPKNARARRLYSDILSCFTRRQHRESFEVFLDLLLDGSGRPLPARATVKSPAAISRFLNHAHWDLRSLCRFMRQAALELFNDTWKHAPHHRPRVEFLVDLTSLEKAGKFTDLSDWMHVLNAVHGVHLVVLYICCGDLKLPWAFQIWRGKGTPSAASLALKLLRTIPPVMLQGKRRPRLHADGGFESAAFIEGVLKRQIDIVIGVRCTRKLVDGTSIHQLMTRGCKAQLKDLVPTMYISWVWLYRNKEPEQRFVMSNVDLGGTYLARVGKRRWRIEAFFKTIKGRFGLARFAQHSKTGVMRWWCLSGLAYLLCHLADQEVPSRPPETWPDWGELARTIRFSFVPEVRRRALQLELDALDAFQHALSATSP
ncbi:transposase [Deinococcus arcticus]|uniref:Transposase n=1 Tax=Deinococcus arcticus TaxID=2136176 RepID=A0A2T3W4M7_9DEIO|nr:transposase [Deinococcus arcticus]PTA66744.1 transposase [Deinococcus arcticus]